jgi:hypothetical protein
MNQRLVVAAAVVVFVLAAVIGEARNQCADGAYWQTCEWVGSTALVH